MKLVLLLIATSSFAQNSITVRVVKNGVVQEAKVSGPTAASITEVFEKWMLTQTVCVTVAEVPAVVVDGKVITPAVPSRQDCAPKFPNAAEMSKFHLMSVFKQLSPQYPSSSLKADVDEVAAKQAAVEAKREKQFTDALAEKP